MTTFPTSTNQPPSSSVSFATIPDLALVRIFDHVPLSEVIRTAGEVCRHWTNVRRWALCRRRSMILYHNEFFDLDSVRHWDESTVGVLSTYGRHSFDPKRSISLWMPLGPSSSPYEPRSSSPLPGKFVSGLLRTLSGSAITTLVVHFDGDNKSQASNLHQLARLFHGLSDSLRSVALYWWDNTWEDIQPGPIEEFGKLFDAWNACHSLRSLTIQLPLCTLPMEVSRLSRLDLRPTLSRLHRLTMLHQANRRWLFEELNHCATEGLLQPCLRIHNAGDVWDFKQWIGDSPNKPVITAATSKFIRSAHFSGNCVTNATMLGSLLRHLSLHWLRWLSVRFTVEKAWMPVMRMLTVELPKLHTAKLLFLSEDLTKEVLPLEGLPALPSRSYPSSPSPSPSSIRALCLGVQLRCHTEAAEFCLRTDDLPDLTALRLRVYMTHCDTCTKGQLFKGFSTTLLNKCRERCVDSILGEHSKLASRAPSNVKIDSKYVYKYDGISDSLFNL